jgi:hypothetical protein
MAHTCWWGSRSVGLYVRMYAARFPKEVAGDHGRDFAAGVSGTARIQFERTWHNLQSELAVLSTDSTHVVVEGAGHSTLQTDQEDAQAAIDQVVEAVRTDRPLTR